MQPANAISPSELLETIAETLDIPNSLYEDAVVRYEDVANWLNADDSSLAVYEPKVYPQGSFRLGTVVRPVSEEDHYDIDLVCQLNIAKENTTQEKLKTLIGDRLEERKDLKEMLNESRRCWNLDYAANFHMDILPCLDNPERKPTGILLTDTELVHWQKSNPIAFANWFRERMKVVFDERRLILAKSLQANVEEVPEWQVRTPLQRVVQLLKRHRDIYFAGRPGDRPVSIILTTLAAQAYGNQRDIYESLETVLAGMSKFIAFENGRYYVRNPIEPDENFADKWNEKPELREAFVEWLSRAQSDFKTALANKPPADAAKALAPLLGTRTLELVTKSLGLPSAAAGDVALVRAEPAVPALGPALHAVTPTWPEKLIGKVWVHGGIYLPNRKGKKLWDLSNRPLPKRVAVKFTAKTNVREPYDLKWQVVNTGVEAQRESQLRGGFYDESGTTHWEDTKYTGTHWVEAFVLKDGVCVARSGRVMVRIRA